MIKSVLRNIFINVFDVPSFVLKSFIAYCHINSDDDQRQLVEILVLDILINKT